MALPERPTAQALEAVRSLLRDLSQRRLWLYGVWFLEVALICGALWGLAHGRSFRSALFAAGYLLACVATFLLPGHVVRSCATKLGLSMRRRRMILHAFLVSSAAAVAATIGANLGWWAIASILATGNALWALELENRAVSGARPSPEGGG